MFFLVVLLLAVFFSMGYLAGRYTAPNTTTVAATRPLVVDAGTPTSLSDPTRPSPSNPTTIDPPKKSDSSSSSSAVDLMIPDKRVDPFAKKGTETASTKEEKRSVVAAEGPKTGKIEPAIPAPTKADKPKVETAKVEPPKPTPKPVEPPPAPASSGGAYPSARGGTFLQVAAAKQPEANVLLNSLSKKGFPVATQEVPGKDLVRVMVGPLKDSAATDSALQQLKSNGFSPIVKKL
ncbi:MAG: SPOR domain-containing protein [Bryobacteraceae bacterium]